MNSITAFVQQEAIPITICLVAGIVALVVLIVLENKRQREREARYRCYIEHNSPRYLALLELNKQYDFSLDIANSHTISASIPKPSLTTTILTALWKARLKKTQMNAPAI